MQKTAYVTVAAASQSHHTKTNMYIFYEFIFFLYDNILITVTILANDSVHLKNNRICLKRNPMLLNNQL